MAEQRPPGGPAPQRLRLSTWLAPVAAFGIAAAVWQLVAGHERYVIPTIPDMASAVAAQPGTFWTDFVVTLREVAVGGACGMGAALALAIVMAEVPLLGRALMPVAVVLNVTPIIAIAPALVVAFGFGSLPKYLDTAIIVFFPFLVNALAGLRSADPGALDVLATLHASRWERFRHLRLPASLPFLFAAARICLPLSVVGAVVAEFSASGQLAGLGSLIQTSQQQSQLGTIWAAIAILALLGVLFTVLVGAAQSAVLRWDAPAGRR